MRFVNSAILLLLVTAFFQPAVANKVAQSTQSHLSSTIATQPTKRPSSLPTTTETISPATTTSITAPEKASRPTTDTPVSENQFTIMTHKEMNKQGSHPGHNKRHYVREGFGKDETRQHV